jgi:hypothetical protein
MEIETVFHVEQNNNWLKIKIWHGNEVWYGRYEISRNGFGVFADKPLCKDKAESILMITVEAIKECKSRALKDALWLEFCKFRQLELPLNS